jgi:hypothetical protein
VIQHYFDGDQLPDVPEYAFSDLWQDRKEGLTFGDFLDIINPLQHIPVVSTIYRMITGDEIGIGARLAGGALYGGPFGALAAGAVAIFEDASGKTVEQHVAALFDGGPDGDPAASQLAGDPPAAPAPAGQTAATEDAPAAATVAATVATVNPNEPPAAGPASSVAPAATRAPPATTAAPATAPDAAAERQRIATAIEKAQRAQAGLLLASIEADRAATKRLDKDGEASSARAATDAERTQPFRSHPYMLPPGAPPHLIGRAMEQALNRYHVMLQQRNAGTTAAAPRPAPAPVR